MNKNNSNQSLRKGKVDNDILNKSGAWFSYNGEKIAQGRDNAVKYLENNPAISDEIESKIREKLGVK